MKKGDIVTMTSKERPSVFYKGWIKETNGVVLKLSTLNGNKILTINCYSFKYHRIETILNKIWNWFN